MTIQHIPPSLARRHGPRPRTTSTNPHTQLDQIAPLDLHSALARRIFALQCVEERPSAISVPGARALWLCNECAADEPAAFMIGREFAHLHPPYDGSLHAALPLALAEAAIEAGWAEPHPMALRGLIPKSIVMLYGPRDDEELDIVGRLVEASRAYACTRR